MSDFTYTQKHCIVMPLKACRLTGKWTGKHGDCAGKWYIHWRIKNV